MSVLQTENKTELLVIGAGQMRTGTFSLKYALERLYGGKCYHMLALVNDHKDHIEFWLNALNRGYLDKETADFLFNGYCSAIDYPSSAFYQDLINIYPNAKVILTTRSTRSWIESVKQTTMKKDFFYLIFLRLSMIFNGLPKFLEMKEKMFERVFHLSKDLRTEENMAIAYETYNEEVRKVVPKERLLEFEVRSGWEPLCTFLGIEEIPDEPFPYINTAKEFRERQRQRFIRVLSKPGALVLFALAMLILTLYGNY